MTTVTVQNVIKTDSETEKNNTILTPRVDNLFWTLLFSSKHDDIQQRWMIILITVSLSQDRWRKGTVTAIVYLSWNSFRAFWNISSSAQLGSSCYLVWISKSGISSIFPSSIGRSKRAHTNDSYMFFGPGQPHINTSAINRPNLSKSPLLNF